MRVFKKALQTNLLKRYSGRPIYQNFATRKQEYNKMLFFVPLLCEVNYSPLTSANQSIQL